MQTIPNRGPDAAQYNPTVKELKDASDPQAKLRKHANTQLSKNNRRVARDTWAMYMAICKAMGLEPEAARTAFAISSLCYDRSGRDFDDPCEISLPAIGAVLSSQSDDKAAKDGNVKAAWEQRAQRHVTPLFTQDLPKAGYQLLARFKSNNGGAHAYVDYGMVVSEFFAQLLEEDRKAIPNAKGKASAVAAARDRLAQQALDEGYFQKLDTAIIQPDGRLYAVVSEPTATAFCKLKPDYKARSYAYKEPTKKPAKPFCSEDLAKLADRDLATIEKHFDEIAARNTPGVARLYATEWLNRAKDRIASWMKTADAVWKDEEGELIHATENDRGYPADEGAEPGPEPGQDEGVPPYKMSGGTDDNPNEDSDLIFDDSQPPSAEPNFDSALEAALFYVRDGWAIVPCKDKVPLIKGHKDAKPGDGYTAASRDKGLITDWFTRQFPDAGVAIRLDGHILIDCDVKNGALGIESFDEVDATFSLPATLMAITPSGGYHHIYKLPDDLPADYLGSWTGILDGIDLKVGNKGLCHVEPTVTKNGVYRWIDPTAEIAELPRAVCDYLHELHEAQQRKPTNSVPVNLPEQVFDPNEDQAKYFRDAPNGQRRPRLRSIACCLAAGGATERQIVDVLKYHDSRFTEPTNDAKFIAHVAQGAVSKFGQGVAQ